ncbi:MAG: hypothetical protein OEY18_18420, partial [Candidatus Aminicenantes bacterium]|nr:hypothetical protein [Candidatus Aminicenantes bacterium]
TDYTTAVSIEAILNYRLNKPDIALSGQQPGDWAAAFFSCYSFSIRNNQEKIILFYPSERDYEQI